MAVVTHKIEVKYRARFGTKSFTVTPSGAGASALSLDDGWYHSFSSLASAVQTKLQTVAGAFSCSVSSAGKVTIAHSGPTNFSIVWSSPTLRDALGFSADLSGAATYTSTEQSPLVFASSLPWYDDAPALTYARKTAGAFRNQRMSTKLAKLRTWTVTARCKHSEVSQWRKTSKMLMQGCPARWFRNADDSAAWSWSNFDGYVDVVLAADSFSLSDLWLAFPVLTDLETPLSFVEWKNEIEGGGGGGGMIGGG